ncbi:MAG: FmdE, Molybdenum formylmethanofuran dehydrogenase operon [Candidatus Syntrophoarchaeum sp. GoM_oil]|nr:MAG: FmdE, Molybdenum formylmethanofuran dehydrogenase operon [Candidatus Syntrophoarchaeum sp. GoM_oil]
MTGNFANENEAHLERAVDFHGHLCGGVIMGVRMGLLALKELGVGRAKGEELVAIVENDTCAVDGIQVVTGCTFGKGNLIFRDWGKIAATFYNRKNKRAIRISVSASAHNKMHEFRETTQRLLRERGDLPFEDLFEEVRKELSGSDLEKDMEKTLLEMGDDELFNVAEVSIEVPAKARMFASVICDECGEAVMETRARLKLGKIVCIPCLEG